MDTTKNIAMMSTAPRRIRYSFVNIPNLYRCLRCFRCAIVVFNAIMIQSKKVESVNASGITKINSTKADVDSSCSSTIPTAYKTGRTLGLT